MLVSAPCLLPTPGFAQTDEHSVVIVTYDDALAFAAWLGRRANRDVTFEGNDEAEASLVGWFKNNAGRGTQPVAAKQLNAFGLFDTSGLRLAAPRLPAHVLEIAGGPDRGCEAYAADLRARARGRAVEWQGKISDVDSFASELDLFTLVAEQRRAHGELVQSLIVRSVRRAEHASIERSLPGGRSRSERARWPVAGSPALPSRFRDPWLAS